MRILHVSHELPPYELAGTAIYTHNIARAQAEDHDVFVFARLQDPKVPAYKIHDEHREGLAIRFVNRADLEWSPFELSYTDPKMTRLFLDYVNEVQPDVIHYQHIVGLGLDVLDVPKQRGITGVYTLHDFWPTCPMGQRMCYTDHQICDPIDFRKCGPCVFGAGWKDQESKEAGALEGRRDTSETPNFKAHFRRRYAETPGRFARKPRAILRAAQRSLAARLAPKPESPSLPFTSNPFEHRFHRLQEKLLALDLMITPSAFLRDMFLKEYHLEPHRVVHSANGMDFSYVKALPKAPSPRVRIGFMGSIIKTKGVHVLVDGFLRAAERAANLELHVFGAPNRWSGDYLNELKAKAAAHPAHDRVQFHGRYDNRRVSEVLQRIDALVLPSIWFENAPLTLNEAAMSRTPIIVSDRGGMLEFVNANGYGLTFQLGDPESLARVLVDLAASPDRLKGLAGDPPPIKSVRANARELVEIYRQLAAKNYVAPTLEEQTKTRGGCLPKA